MTTSTLPELNIERLSIAIRQAVQDLEWAEQHENFDVDMDRWVKFEKRVVGSRVVCCVCLAGATIARRLNDQQWLDKGLSASDTISRGLSNRSPQCYEYRVDRMLRALNCVRAGAYLAAIEKVGPPLPKDFVVVKILHDKFSETGSYEDDPDQFKKRLLDIAEELEKHGY